MIFILSIKSICVKSSQIRVATTVTMASTLLIKSNRCLNILFDAKTIFVTQT